MKCAFIGKVKLSGREGRDNAGGECWLFCEPLAVDGSCSRAAQTASSALHLGRALYVLPG